MSTIGGLRDDVGQSINVLIQYIIPACLRLATISVSKAKKCLMILGLSMKSEDIQAASRQSIDAMDQASFLRLAASRRIQSDKGLEAFELMDKDGKGVVVLEDLQRVAQDLGEDISREELVEMIALADRSGEGLLTPQDFVRVARKVNL